MKAYQELSREELLSLKAKLEKEYEDAKGKGRFLKFGAAMLM